MVKRIIIPCDTKQALNDSLLDILHGKPVKRAAMPLFPGLAFADDGETYLEIAAYPLIDRLRVFITLGRRCDREQCSVLEVITAKAFHYPHSTAPAQIAQDVADRMWGLVEQHTQADRRPVLGLD
jgi:hypothetical protein